MLFGSAYKLEIIPGKHEFSYEEPIRYKVVLDMKKDKEIRQLKTDVSVIVKGSTTCWYEESEEETEEAREAFFKFTYVKHEEKLLEHAKPGKGRHEFEIKAPPLTGMPVPGNYGLFDVEWRIRAEIPGFPRKTSAEKTIRVRKPGKPGSTEKIEARTSEARAIIILPRYVPLGSSFRVGIELHPLSRQLECKELTLKLHSSLRVLKENIDPSAKNCSEPKHEETHESIKLAENLTITDNKPFIKELTLKIPAKGHPSFKHYRSGSEWKIILECKKGLLRTTKIEIPITII